MFHLLTVEYLTTNKKNQMITLDDILCKFKLFIKLVGVVSICSSFVVSLEGILSDRQQEMEILSL